MNILAQVVLLAWLPVILLFFLLLPPRRALVAAAVTAWLFLPNGGFDIPGLPNYTKFTATSGGVLLGAALFDRRRLLAFRPRWFDAPMAAWGLAHFATNEANGLGWYAGMSDFAFWLTVMATPYLVGRVYLADLPGLRGLATGVVLGGLVYAPLCLYESWAGPTLGARVYGAAVTEQATRFGLGFRPVVFLESGLHTGMWMAVAAVTAYWTWSCGRSARSRDRGGFVPPAVAVALLAVTAVLTKSVGAVALLAAGAGALWLVRRTGRTAAVTALLFLPVVYMAVRIPGVWSGEQLVRLTSRLFGHDRAWSLVVRLISEDGLVARALERPVWGWGGFGRNRGEGTGLTDGYWVIVLGTLGLVGLSAWAVSSLLPAWLFLKRTRARGLAWSDPELAPASALAVVTVLYTIDCLSNSMITPIYVMAMGGLAGLTRLPPPRPAGGSLARGLRPRDAGEPAAAADENALRRAPGRRDGRRRPRRAGDPRGLPRGPRRAAPRRRPRRRGGRAAPRRRDGPPRPPRRRRRVPRGPRGPGGRAGVVRAGHPGVGRG